MGSADNCDTPKYKKKKSSKNTQKSVGAAGPILAEAVERVSSALNGGSDVSSDAFATTIRKSFVLSSDQAHALHPNYSAKHEKNHQPQMNGGMVIKRNANQRYATNGVTGVLIREIARRASLPPVQEFIVRQDCGCGSTIGPLISTATGIRVSRKEEQTNHQLFAYDVLLLLLWWLLTRFA